jgi:hypothetical protein
MAGGELFEWCAARPLWQQEAIRLLTAKPKLDDEELAQLQRAIKIEAGLLSEKPSTWSALTKTHLKGGNLFAPVTVLGSIGPLRNIDRLAAEQPPLRFAINGVTLIYGANGSGKSGYCHIAKHSDGRFGIIDDDQRPWISLKVNKRLELIDGLLHQRKATYSETDQANRSFVTEIYTKMRETWEHSIEEILFADVVGRFRPNITTMKLRAARIEKADYEAVLAGMTRCSKFSGHDQSVGAPADLPKFEVMKTDLEALRSFITASNKRKKVLEEEGKAFEAGPMAAAVLE